MPPRPPAVPRPTHFLALPLHNHSTLRNKVGAFHKGLFDEQGTPLVRGLDKSIVIDPRRLHLTLGVMALDDEARTTDDALKLLDSIKPRLRTLLGEERKAVKVKLEILDVLKTERKRDGEIDAHVLYLGVNESDEETVQLKRVSDMVHQTFRTAGYITETRPLKLHCTILNTSYRRPRGEAFSYSDIVKLTPTPLNFGTYDVGRVELWVMGSHGRNNEYVSCGGISLG